ncbi:MAG: response regulator [Ardenticatenales bacterium]|nr:response regulator [Ardenticatenales bacterium]
MAKILIVDDSKLSRRTMRRILESAAHEVVEASEGMSALEQYVVEQPDLVIMDLTMHGMHGLDLLAQLHSLNPMGRFIVASADIQRTTLVMVEGAGASAFIPKPFMADHVLNTVHSVLAGGQHDPH